MIVVDTSAILAIFLCEPEAHGFAEAIAGDEAPLVSVASLFEASIVLRAKKEISVDQADDWLDRFVAAAGLGIEPVTADHGRLARAAHRLYGKGTGHPARLNYGDCFTYALAKGYDVPLLFKGDDFCHTDLRMAPRFRTG